MLERRDIHVRAEEKNTYHSPERTKMAPNSGFLRFRRRRGPVFYSDQPWPPVGTPNPIYSSIDPIRFSQLSYERPSQNGRNLPTGGRSCYSTIGQFFSTYFFRHGHGVGRGNVGVEAMGHPRVDPLESRRRTDGATEPVEIETKRELAERDDESAWGTARAVVRGSRERR